MKDFIILKESYLDGDKQVEAYSALTQALRDNGVSSYLYDKVRAQFKKNQPFIYGKILFRKVKFNQNHRMKQKWSTKKMIQE